MNRVSEQICANWPIVVASMEVAPPGATYRRVAPARQSFLGRFKTWSIDNAGRKLVLEPK